jgi:protein phosphatase-4 regulatory subunit 3
MSLRLCWTILCPAILPPAFGQFVSQSVLLTSSRAQNEATRQEEPRVLVQSEDHSDRMLLETRICKEDGFQKQQGTFVSHHISSPRLISSLETLIVWTEPSNSTDMALSFQEAEGCSIIWLALNKQATNMARIC